MSGRATVDDPVAVQLTRDLQSATWPARRTAATRLGDTGPGAAGAVRALIQALGKLGPIAAEAAPVLRELLHDPDPSVRAATEASLRRIGGSI